MPPLPTDRSKPRIATLGSLGAGNDDGPDVDSGDDDARQTYFVGGGRAAGQLVEDPNTNSLLSRLFGQAARQSVPQADEGEDQKSVDPFASSRGFRLTGEAAPMADKVKSGITVKKKHG